MHIRFLLDSTRNYWRQLFCETLWSVLQRRNLQICKTVALIKYIHGNVMVKKKIPLLEKRQIWILYSTEQQTSLRSARTRKLSQQGTERCFLICWTVKVRECVKIEVTWESPLHSRHIQVQVRFFCAFWIPCTEWTLPVLLQISSKIKPNVIAYLQQGILLLILDVLWLCRCIKLSSRCQMKK